MFLADKTVKNYVSSVLSKLGLERRTQAAVLATKLLGDEGPLAVRAITSPAICERTDVNNGPAIKAGPFGLGTRRTRAIPMAG